MRKEDLDFLEDYYGEDVQALVCEYKRLSKELEELKEESERKEWILLNQIDSMGDEMWHITRYGSNPWKYWENKKSHDKLLEEYESRDYNTYGELLGDYYMEIAKRQF